MITSKLTNKARTTIPEPVLAALGLNGGDEIAYVIDADRVSLRRADRVRVDDPFRTFEEWDSEADRRAYADLSAG